jgi:hypothetical protein
MTATVASSRAGMASDGQQCGWAAQTFESSGVRGLQQVAGRDMQCGWELESELLLQRGR